MQQKTASQQNQYMITLTQQIKDDQFSNKQSFSFRNLENDYQTIYENFNMLYYFVLDCGITIIDRIKGDKVFKFYIKATEQITELNAKFFYLQEKQKEKFSIQSQSLKIKYEISQTLQMENSYLISTQFTTEKRGQRSYIHINIVDHGNWIKSNVHLTLQKNRFSHALSMGQNYLQYFYQQPLSSRNKKQSEKHFAIALQGGGVKGVAYIGAYRTLRKQYPQIPISSIIGSSAGGMLGLAICCQLTQYQIQQLCKDELSTITEDQKYKYFDQTRRDQLLNQITNILKTYGIVQDDVISFIHTITSDQKFLKAVEKIMTAFNPQIKKLFMAKNKDGQQLTIRSLLEGQLMTGQKIRQFAIKCLIYLRNPFNQERVYQWEKRFLESRFKIKEQAKKINIEQDDDVKWAQKITMKDLYNITKSQFTCTAVDLQSKVLRFFNHKTTPDLPVCYAVQMTGSFPIAFESQKWKSQWGKYFIHYDHCRRQIDLKDHQFTDGGVLANFPIKYLDNQYMRPMYFSHAKINKEEQGRQNQNYTIIWGFGLNSVKPKLNLQKQFQQFSKTLNEIVDEHITWYNKIGIAFRGLKAAITHSNEIDISISKQRNPIEDLQKIPVFKFLGKLINTYIETKDNLTQECFAHRVYQTQVSKQLINDLGIGKENYRKIEESFMDYQKLKTSLSKIESFANQPHENDKLCQIVRKNLQFIAKQLSCYNDKTKFSVYSEENIFQVVVILKNACKSMFFMENYLDKNYQIKFADPKKKFSEQFKVQIQELQNMKKQNIFSLCSIKNDHETLEKIVVDLLQWCQQAEKQLQVLSPIYQQIRTHEKAIIKEIYGNFQDYKKNFQQQIKKAGTQEEKRKINLKNTSVPSMPPKIIFSILQLKKWSLTIPLEKVTFQLYEQLKKSRITQMIIMNESYNKKISIDSYVTGLLHEGFKKKKKGVHIVLQSIVFSELYMNEYLNIVKNSLILFNQREKQRQKQKAQKFQHLRITSMTASNYHSLVMFFYACDFTSQYITDRLWKVSKLIRLNPIIYQKQFQEEKLKQIFKLKELRMKEVCQNAWNQRKDIYEYATNVIDDKLGLYRDNKIHLDQSQLTEMVSNLVYQISSSKQDIGSAIQNSLNFVVDELLNIDSKEIRQQHLKQIGKRLAINLKNAQNYEQYAKNDQQKVGELLEVIGTRFFELIKYFFYSSPSIREEIITKVQSQSDRKQIWKSLFVEGALHTLELKKLVCNSLIDIGLTANSTLQQLYEYNDAKVLLNFAVISSKSECIQFLNKKTCPNMPVWAAIVASCSSVDFFKPLHQRKSWRKGNNIQLKKNFEKKYFDDKHSQYNYLSSADLITKLPLQLLTNHKINQQISDMKNQIFLAFNFKNIPLPDSLWMNNQIKTKAFTLLGLKLDLDKFKHMNNLLQLPTIENKMKKFATYENSHDNLITKIYAKQLVKLPIRLQTLDFDKIIKDGKLSDDVRDSIRQCEIITRQLMYNAEKLSSNDRIMCFAISKNGDNQLQLRYLSSLNLTKSLSERYRIFYSKSLAQQLHKQPINITDKIVLKFVYPFQKNKQSKIEKRIIIHQLNFSNFYNNKNQIKINIKQFLIYQLKFIEYKKDNAELIPVDVDQLPQSPKIPIQYSSFIQQHYTAPNQIYCDACRCSSIFLQWQILQRQSKTQKKKCGVGNCSININQKSKMFGRMLYKCNKCKTQFCVLCKYKPYVSDNRDFFCPLQHPILRVNFKDSMLLYCDLCQSFSSNYFMIDKTCNITICQNCIFLTIYKNSKKMPNINN